MDRWTGKTAIVTGASSGIGEAIVKRLVEAGLKVAGFARRLDKMQELSQTLSDKSGKLYPIKCDVTKEDEIIKSMQWAIDHLGPVHILVNNAGVARPTTLLEGSTEEWKKVIDTNFLGLCICTREAVKSMQQNNIAGHVVHINSVCGHYVPPLPLNNVYPGTKYAVTALTETLRKELNSAGSSIKVTSVSPGFVKTEIITANGFQIDEEDLESIPALKPEDVADAVLYTLGTAPHIMIQELTIRPVGERL